MMNTSSLIGRLVKDPELRTTSAGLSVMSNKIAVPRAYVKQGEERETDFIPVVFWRRDAEYVAQNAKKGTLLGIEGSIQSRNFEDKEGNKKTAIEVIVKNVTIIGRKDSNENKPVEIPEEIGTEEREGTEEGTGNLSEGISDREV